MIKHIPFLDMKSPYIEIKSELDEAYQRVMESGWYIMGEEVENFEQKYAAYCGIQCCIGVGNGLEALHLVLRAYNIGQGDEVIVPANTYIATWLAISYCGATPVPIEPDSRTYNIDPERVETAVNSRTRAILPVHLYGQPADMQPLREIADHRGILLIEDAAQSQGAKYNGNSTSTLADAGGTSFYPGKNLGALGDGGAVLTNDQTLAEKVRMLRNYGSKRKYYNEVKGFNSRLDPLHAAFLTVKLRHLDNWNARRRQIADFYMKVLAGLPELSLPFIPKWVSPSWHIFAVLHPRRDDLQKMLKQNGIETLIHYPVPPHLSQAYSEYNSSGKSFPITEKIARSELSLPMGPHLSLDQAAYVADTVRAFCFSS
jgi:dTDP-4-amino-4,6-dideoxygalactose transaminase